MNRNPQPAHQRGISLIECLMVMAILGIVLGSALPSFAKLIDRQRLRAATAEFRTDVQWLRSEAQQRGQAVHLRIDSANACYVIHTGSGSAGCTCDGVCTGDAQVLKTTALGGGRLRLDSRVTTMRYEPRPGTFTPTNTLSFATRDGTTLNQVVAITGRVRSCSPEGAIGDVPRCR